ncbi:MAG: TylF/MycF family methyltransferase, partial [Clostridiales bacterium]|nr:TylF/MycF family methyltransferase [Clostridiales bacterium]
EIYEKAKWLFTYRFAELAKERGIGGSVAEAGVFQGNFSKEINKAFPDRNLYLFDTFESFDERDLLIEQAHGFSNRKSDFFNNTSVETVLSKLPHRSKAIVKQGYFPDTFDLKDERFCFVNLDMDLYKPTKDGLRLFWPLMERGGVILVHDYFSDDFKGAKQAFDEFCAENDLFGFPIGDDFTMALIKQ